MKLGVQNALVYGSLPVAFTCACLTKIHLVSQTVDYCYQNYVGNYFATGCLALINDVLHIRVHSGRRPFRQLIDGRCATGETTKSFMKYLRRLASRMDFPHIIIDVNPTKEIVWSRVVQHRLAMFCTHGFTSADVLLCS